MCAQALSQCDSYLRGMRGVTCEAVYDTAGAAEGIATGQLRCARACIIPLAVLAVHGLTAPVPVLHAKPLGIYI